MSFPAASNDSFESRISNALRSDQAPAPEPAPEGARRPAPSRDEQGRFAPRDPDQRGPVLNFDDPGFDSPALSDGAVDALLPDVEPDTGSEGRTPREAAPPDSADEEGGERAGETQRAESEEPASQEPQGPQMLAEIAGEYDATPDDFLDTIHIEGDDGPVSLADVVRTYREAPQRVESEISQHRRELDAQRAQIEEAAGQRLGELRQLYEEASAVLGAEREPDWRRLEEEDPERFAQERVRWVKRQDALRAVRERLEQEYETRERGYQEQVQRYVQDQAQALLQRKPEWRDQARRTAALKQVDTYLRQEVGFTDEQLAGPLDHRMIEVAWEASEYRRLAKRAGLEGKRMKRLSRAAQSGARKGEGNDAGRVRRIAQKSAALRRTGSEDAAVSLFEEIL